MTKRTKQGEEKGVQLPEKFDRQPGGVFRLYNSDTINAGVVKKEGYRIDWDGKEFPSFSFSLVLRGKGVYIDSEGKRHPLGPGNAFFRVPGVPHTTLLDPKSHWLEFFIDFRFHAQNGVPSPQTKESGRRRRKSPSGPTLSSPASYLNGAVIRNEDRLDNSWVYPMFRHIFSMDAPHLVRQIPLSESVLDLCADFLECLKRERDETLLPLRAFAVIFRILETRTQNHADGICVRIRNIVRDNIANSTPLPELLKELPLSYASLRKHFYDVTGMNIGEYQIQCRIESAVNMLLDGLSVKEAAMKLGYKDQFFFSKQFRQQMGYPPSYVSRHRQQMRKRGGGPSDRWTDALS